MKDQWAQKRYLHDFWDEEIPLARSRGREKPIPLRREIVQLILDDVIKEGERNHKTDLSYYQNKMNLEELQCRLAFEENEMICYVPEDAKLGDLICQFPNCDVAAIIHPEQSQRSDGKGATYKIVGRAVHFLKHPAPALSRPFRCFREEEDDNTPDNNSNMPHYPIDFHLDLQTLQLLTHAFEF